jgi:hypothetical protein
MENLAKVAKERDAERAERAAREAEARALEKRLEQESKRLEGLQAEVADMTDKYTARLAELQAEHRAAVAGSEQLVKDKDAIAERRAPAAAPAAPRVRASRAVAAAAALSDGGGARGQTGGGGCGGGGRTGRAQEPAGAAGRATREPREGAPPAGSRARTHSLPPAARGRRSLPAERAAADRIS